MRHIIAFSGGFDSTYALIRLMEQCSETDEILAVSIMHRITGDAKLRREANARVLILAELQKLYPKVKLENYEIDVNVPWEIGSGGNSQGLSQPIFWITNLVPILKNGDEVTLGYLLEDQATLHMEDIYRFWNSALRIQENKDVKLKMPLKYYTKVEIITILMQHYSTVVDYCTSCESLLNNARRSNCGNCIPCYHLRNALICIAADTNLLDSIRDKAKQMLADRFDLDVSITMKGSTEKVIEVPDLDIKKGEELCES